MDLPGAKLRRHVSPDTSVACISHECHMANTDHLGGARQYLTWILIQQVSYLDDSMVGVSFGYQ